jgi:ATP-binding cassette subfamily B protein
VTASASGWDWVRRVLRYCMRHKDSLLLCFSGALVASVVGALVPLLLRTVVDDVVANRSASVTPWIVLLLASGAVRFGAGFLRRYGAGRLSLDVQYDMRNDVFAALQRLDGASQDELQTGQVVSRAISDIGLVQGILQFLPSLAGNVLLFLVSLVVMVSLSPPLTLIALAIAPAVWFLAYSSRRDLFPANWAAQQEAGEVVGRAEAAISGVRVVKGFGQEQRELEELDQGVRALFAARMRVVRRTSRYNPALQAIPSLGQVGVLVLGGWLALEGQITIGTFLAFSAYLGQLVAPVRQLAMLLVVGQQARAGVERVTEVIDSQPLITDRTGAVQLPAAPVDLELDSVSFGYVRSRPVLQRLSLRVAAGETVALVGASGSGKSTVSLLLPRFYDVQAGAVRIAGHDVRDVQLDSLRSRIGVVFEDTLLFSDTVRANIAYGRPDATEDQVVAAARAAEADAFVRELPDGYETVVGEQGLTLSGGQRQRVALARALLSEPQILLLDDATSAVDSRVEAAIHATLGRAMRGRTTLLIAHRRSTLALADRIAVLDQGRLVDIGTEADLTARCPLFRLLLSGPGTDAEGGGVTPARRPHGEAGSGDRGSRRAAATLAGSGAAAGGGRGSRAMGGGVLASVPASPELLARVAALPAATDRPRVAAAVTHAPDSRFTLAGLLGTFRLPLLLGLLLVGLDALAQLLVPALVRTGVDQGVSGHALRVLLISSAVALLIVLADWVVGTWQVRVTGRTGELLLYTLRVKSFAHLMRLGLDYYERELGGRIMTRLTTDVDALSSFLQTGLATTVVSLFSIGGVLVALMLLDASLGLLLAAVIPVLLVATLLFRSRAVPAYAEARERVSRVNAELQEKVAGVRVTQAFRRERRNDRAFRQLGADYRDSRLRAQRYIATYFPFLELVSAVATALVLAVGAAQVRAGALTVGVLIAFLLYIDLFFSPVQSLSQVFDGYQQASIGLRRLRDLLRTPTSTPPSPRPRPVARLRGEVVFDAVRFAYTGSRREALSGIELRVAPGETVALVGETGAGKSTMVKLVARFYDPTSGVVRVDGTDLRELDLQGYRRRLGVVPQEAHLLGETVRDAIAYGRPRARDAEVEAAARAVGAHDVVARLPRAYLTPVGERGRNLSAGQRQLIALARAELVDPDILLLDEATASLDLVSEAAVARAAELVAGRRTTFVVAHRLTTAARADRIIVLDRGRIVEAGTHAELVEGGGFYARLWEAFARTAAA